DLQAVLRGSGDRRHPPQHRGGVEEVEELPREPDVPLQLLALLRVIATFDVVDAAARAAPGRPVEAALERLLGTLDPVAQERVAQPDILARSAAGCREPRFEVEL